MHNHTKTFDITIETLLLSLSGIVGTLVEIGGRITSKYQVLRL